MNDKKAELIAQLLTKAESTTPEEAEALTEHAERLMIKYGIELAQLQSRRSAHGQQAESIVAQRIDLRGAYALDLRDGFAAVARALGLQPAHASISATEQALFVYGFESDARAAHTLLLSLQVQAVVAMRAWWRQHRDEYAWHTAWEREKARGGFLRGFGMGAAERIRRNREQAVAAAGSGTELVLASREQRVADHVNTLGMRRARGRGVSDGAATGYGYREGQRANTGERAVAARGRLTA
ncbi:DUF2786 domain-containing protein [Microbacterium terrisoli]|uniref:DUF2786 domain-containing protein n=1 Tax=Microbacterium terrisoli TaxID=3242192 RepID=UPI0028055FFC|nr:DUF2786 domain-containing protein [Microbacterium protaetiae]